MAKVRRNFLFATLMLSVVIPKVIGEDGTGLPLHGGLHSFPVPPHQSDAWTAPKTEVAPAFISSTTLLFDQGMADPRGCDYCTITVGADGTFFGNGRVARCRGWLLPASKDDPSLHFAVCWDGLIHRVVTVGERADLESDVRTLIKNEIAFRTGGKPEFDPEVNYQEIDGGVAISRNALLPEKICLLLRLGKADLATDLWKQYAAAYPVDDPRQIYLVVAHSLMMNALARAVGAHRRGEGQLAWLSDLALQDLQASVNAEIASQKIPIKENEFSDLGVLPDLLADDERRAHSEPHTTAIERGRDAFASKEEWIHALIDSLDQVTGEPFHNTWYSVTDYDPIVMALTACGDDAIGPLIDCYANDNRATRQIDDGKLLMVCDVALNIVLNRLQEHQFDQNNLDRDHLVRQISDYWEKYKRFSPPDRWFLTLTDNDADPTRWGEAMSQIVAPADGDESSNRVIWTRKPGGRPVKGDRLRTKVHPSVLDVATKRILALDQAQGTPSFDPTQAANTLAMALAEWDPVHALPALRHQMGYSAGLPQQYLTADSGFQRSIAHLAMTMASAGDKSGLKTYSEWFQSQQLGPFSLAFGDKTLFMPLYMFPDDPSMIAASKWIFEDKTSPWKTILSQHGDQWVGGCVLASPLLGTETCRSYVLKILLDQTEIGTVMVKPGRYVELNFGRYPSQIRIGTEQIPLPPVGTVVKVRTCDQCANALSVIPGMPLCQMYWSLADRDAAIAACSQTVKQYGRQLKDKEQAGLENDVHTSVPTSFVFPALNHPADKKDVASGGAIFSLEGMGARRTISTRHFPRVARWIALKKYPVDSSMLGADGHQTNVVNYWQDCLIWQVEEVFVSGKWKRFYGVQGPHELAKVSAEEISFAGWSQSPPDREPLVMDLEGLNPSRYYTAKPAQPLHINLSVYNQSGLPVSIPANLIVKLDNDRLALRPGVTLTLEKLKAADDDDTNSNWVSMPLKTSIEVLDPKLQSEMKVIEADQRITLFDLNLDDYFKLTESGSYQVTVRVADHCGLGESPAEYASWFQLQ